MAHQGLLPAQQQQQLGLGGGPGGSSAQSPSSFQQQQQQQQLGSSSTIVPPAAPSTTRSRSRSNSAGSSSLGSHHDSDDSSDDDQLQQTQAGEEVEASGSTVVQGTTGGGLPSEGPKKPKHGSGKKGKPKDKDGNAPARKQNVACDPCRSRKVKCLRTNGSDKCDSCLAKNLVCTNHYVSSLANKERRRPTSDKPRTKSGSSSGPSGTHGPPPGEGPKKRKVSHDRTPSNNSRPSSSHGRPAQRSNEPHPPGMHYPGASSSSSSAQQPFPLPSQSQNQQIQYQPPYRDFLPPAAMQFGHPGYAQNLQPGQPYPFPPVGVDQTAFPLSHQKMTASTSQLQQLSQQHSHYPKAYPFAPAQMYHQPSPSTSTFGQNPPHPPAGAQPPLRLQAFPPPMSSLLAYLFSPTEVTTAELGYTDQTLVGHEGGKNELFDEPPSLAHRDLMVEALRMEVANDLIESYFQIVHIRMPLLAQSVFKSEFESSQASHVKLAVVLALGAKFSEHPIIVMDRDQTSDPTVTVSINGSPVTKRTSRLVRLLVARAQQVLEVHRAYRSPTIDNIQACLLMEGLLNPKPAESTPGRDVPSHSKGFWTTVAIRHLLELRCNHMSSILAIEDELRRGGLLFAWWLACLSDSMGAFFWRQRPLLCDDDYDNEPPVAWDGEHFQPVDNPDQYKCWYMSAHDLAKIAREACRRLWTPRVEKAGIPLASLQHLIDLLCAWRDNNLSMVAVPNQWPATWDFVHAVTACAADSNFHVMWICIHRGLLDYDILENNEIRAGRTSPTPELTAQIDKVRSQLSQEAAHAATRISALAVVLTTNGYLRLDPNVLHYPVLEAGTFLARYGMIEVEGCINGLRQYGTTYEECYAQADALQHSYDEARTRGLAAAALASAQAQAAGPMDVTPESSLPLAVSFPPHRNGDDASANGHGSFDAQPSEFQHQTNGSLPSDVVAGAPSPSGSVTTWSLSAPDSKDIYAPFAGPSSTSSSAFAQASQ